MVFQHPGKGNAAAAAPEEVLEKLPRFELPGESVNRRRYVMPTILTN